MNVRQLFAALCLGYSLLLTANPQAELNDFEFDIDECSLQALLAQVPDIDLGDTQNISSLDASYLEAVSNEQTQASKAAEPYVSPIYSTSDYGHLGEFAKRATIEMILHVAAKNPTLFRVNAAQDKLFLLPANKLGSLLLEHHELLIEDFAKRAPAIHFMRVVLGNEQLKQYPEIKQRIEYLGNHFEERKEEQKSADTDVKEQPKIFILETFAKRDPSFKGHDRYYYDPGLFFHHENDKRDTRVKDRWTRFREMQHTARPADGDLLESMPYHVRIESLGDISRNYHLLQKNPNTLPALHQLLKNAHEDEIEGLITHLNPSHFASCYEAMDKRLSQQKVWKKLEDKALKLQRDSSIYEILPEEYRTFLDKKVREIRNRRDHVSSTLIAFEEYLNDPSEKLIQRFGDHFLDAVKHIHTDKRFEVELNDALEGKGEELYKAAAEATYYKVARLVEKNSHFKTQKEEAEFLRQATHLEQHTKDYFFKTLLTQRGSANYEAFKQKVVQCLENQKISDHFGLPRERLDQLAETFHIDQKTLKAIYHNPAQDNVQREGVKLLNYLVDHGRTDNAGATMGDCVNVAFALNAAKQVDKAAGLIRNLRSLCQALMGVSHELWNDAVDQTISTLMFIPVAATISTGAAALGLSAPAVLAATALGCTLYYLSSRPEEIKQELNNLSEAIAENKPYEMGRIITRLGLSATGAAIATRSVKKALTDAFKKGVLKETAKAIRKGLKAQKTVDSKEFKESLLAALPEVAKIKQINGSDNVNLAQHILGANAVSRANYTSELSSLSENLKKIRTSPRYELFLHEGADKKEPVTRKNIQEALCGIAAEAQGLLKDLHRSSNKAEEFIDSFGRAWDVKYAVSRDKKNNHIFESSHFYNNIREEFRRGEHVIVDITDLEKVDFEDLMSLISANFSLEELKKTLILHRTDANQSKFLGE